MIITCWRCNFFKIYFNPNILNMSIECINEFFVHNFVIDPSSIYNGSFDLVLIASCSFQSPLLSFTVFLAFGPWKWPRNTSTTSFCSHQENDGIPRHYTIYASTPCNSSVLPLETFNDMGSPSVYRLPQNTCSSQCFDKA